MNEYRIITNNKPRDVVDACELTQAERHYFDYLDWNAIEDGRDSASFFRYAGSTYDLGEFMTTSMPFGAPDLARLGWHGYMSDSFFSAIVVRYVEDNERIVVGRCLS